MRVLVCGSRTWENYSAIKNRLALFADDTVIVHGAARGADEMAAKAALELGLAIDLPPTFANPLGGYPAEWERYGKRAGYIRNRQMIDSGVGLVIAFWRGESPGTASTIDLAQRCDLPVEIHEWPK